MRFHQADAPTGADIAHDEMFKEHTFPDPILPDQVKTLPAILQRDADLSIGWVSSQNCPIRWPHPAGRHGSGSAVWRLAVALSVGQDRSMSGRGFSGGCTG